MIGAKEARAMFSKHIEETNIKAAAEAWMEDNLDKKIRQSSQTGFSCITIGIPPLYGMYCAKTLKDLGYYVQAHGKHYENDKEVLKVYISW